MQTLISQQKALLLLGISLLSVTVIFLVERIDQDQAYHLFADTRVLAVVPNFVNVISNLPFVIVGALGVTLCLLARTAEILGDTRLPYLMFFIGVLLTGFGSAYYHLHPDNFTLLWDRLPLAALSVALFCAVVSECISAQAGARLLLPLMAAGLFSVFYWYVTELKGVGDLRPYALAQFLPMLLMPLILWWYGGNAKGCGFIWRVLGVYVLARIAESFDAEIYKSLHFISGHSIKHLLAGLSTYIVYAALKRRTINVV